MDTLEQSTPSRTELTDSLLHTNVKRMLLGIVCGILSGFVMLAITTLFTPEGSSKLWWLQLAASMFHGGEAFSYEAGQSVFITGFLIHLFFSGFCGFLLGKMTTTHSFQKLTTYGLVLGGLCWLASNMFGPDLFNVQGLDAVGEWARIAFFVPFGIIAGLLLAVTSRALRA